MEKLSANLQSKIKANPLETILRNEDRVADVGYNQIKKVRTRRKNVDIPDEFDGRVAWKGLLNPVGDQGTCGSCWAWAAVNTLADRFNIQSVGLMRIKLSVAKLILCDMQGREFEIKHPEEHQSEVARLLSKSLQEGSCYGNTLYDAWRYLFLIGTVPEECFPYDFDPEHTGIETKLADFHNPASIPLCTNVSGPFGDMCSDYTYDKSTGKIDGTPSRFYRCLHIYSLPGTEKDGGDELTIRHNIYLWGPVSTGFKVYPDFYTFDAAREIYKWNGVGPQVGGHAVEIVGWGIEGDTKYWIIKNSWGVGWGEDGYFRMIRGENECDIENNVITGAPDFFLPTSQQLKKGGIWSEPPELVEKHRQIIQQLDIQGGGIDPETGYSRRVMYNMPWIKFIKPVPLDNLPDWSSFIAGRDATETNRVKYKSYIKNMQIENRQETNNSITVMTLSLVLLTGLVVFFILYKKTNIFR